MKMYVEVGIYLFLALCLEVVFRFFGLPITVGDLILLGLNALFVFIVLPHLFSTANGSILNREGSTRFVSKLLNCFYALIFIFFGLSLIYIGVSEPLTLLTGVKGAAHGYSLVITGASIIIVVVLMVCIYFTNKNA